MRIALDVHQNEEERKSFIICQTSLPSVFIWAFCCLWKLSQANTTLYLFIVGFFLKEERCNQQAICCNVWAGTTAFSTSPFDGAPQLRNERGAGWTASGKWVSRDSRWAGRRLWAAPAPALCLIWVKSVLLSLISLIFWMAELLQSTEYVCIPRSIGAFPKGFKISQARNKLRPLTAV